MSNDEKSWKPIKNVISSNREINQFKLNHDNIAPPRYNEAPTEISFIQLIYKTVRSNQTVP